MKTEVNFIKVKYEGGIELDRKQYWLASFNSYDNAELFCKAIINEEYNNRIVSQTGPNVTNNEEKYEMYLMFTVKNTEDEIEYLQIHCIKEY